MGKKNEKFVYLQFAVKDGQTTYNITERSLGFRWFFSFLLFTMYRTKDGEKKPTLFLLDEPAANMHSGAQTQLLDSFPRIAKNGSQIIYSTHSHYMIEPTWFDQAYIVANRGVDYSRIDEGNKTVSNRPTDISAEKYRTFVGQNPDKETYFQPVLDRLKVTPSRLDLIKKSVLVEGKGDYFILEYGRKVIMNSTSSVAIVPTKGADGMDDLIGLFMGWNVNFLICLDDDKPGQKARTKYINEWGLADNMVVTLQAVHSSLSGNTIEGFLSTDDLKLISLSYGIKDAPSKSQIQLFFSEKLAKKEKVGMSKTFEEKISALEQLLAARFPSDNNLRD